MYREIFPVLIIVLMFSIAIYSEPRVMTNDRGEMPGHWNFAGKADGYVNKTVGIYLLPVIALILYLSMLVIPKIEVYQKNLEGFDQQFWGFRVVLVFVMGAIYVATLLPSLGYWGNIDPVWIMVPAIALLFFYVGYMLNFTKRNYFIGVRTPWTLADEKIWEKTNHLASKLFWICGVLTLVSLISPADFRLWIILLPVVLAAIIATLYSLYEYKKAKGHQASESERRAKGAKGRKGKK